MAKPPRARKRRGSFSNVRSTKKDRQKSQKGKPRSKFTRGNKLPGDDDDDDDADSTPYPFDRKTHSQSLARQPGLPVYLHRQGFEFETLQYERFTKSDLVPAGREISDPVPLVPFPVEAALEPAYRGQWSAEIEASDIWQNKTQVDSLKTIQPNQVAFYPNPGVEQSNITGWYFFDWAGEVTTNNAPWSVPLEILVNLAADNGDNARQRIVVNDALGTYTVENVKLAYSERVKGFLDLAMVPHVHADNFYSDTWWKNTFVPPMRQAPRRQQVRDPLELMYTFCMYWFTRFCSSPYRRHRLAWFLVYWLGVDLCTQEAENLTRINGSYTVQTSIFMYLIRLLKEIIGLQGERITTLFHPFIRGFIDEPQKWTFRKDVDESDGKVLRRYLQLPDDPSDPLANVLRQHPNTYLVRLCPTHERHLDLICYHVPPPTGPRNRRMRYVVFYRLDVVSGLSILNTVESGSTDINPAAITAWPSTDMSNISLCRAYFWLQNCYVNRRAARVPPGTPAGLPPAFKRMRFSFSSLLMAMMRKVGEASEFAPYFPLTTAQGSYLDYEFYSCQATDGSQRLARQKRLVDYARYFRAFGQQADFWRTTLELGSFFPVAPPPSARSINQISESSGLFPTMDNFGDPGWSASPTWMTEDLPAAVSRPKPSAPSRTGTGARANALMRTLYREALAEFYTGSLWECSAEKVQRRCVWHLVRWLGLTYWTQHFLARANPKDRVPEDVEKIRNVLLFLLSSGSVYPFYTADMADNMISGLGNPEAQRRGAVVRLSTSVVLGLDVRVRTQLSSWDEYYKLHGTHPGTILTSKLAANARQSREQRPYAFVTTTIPFAEWKNWFTAVPRNFATVDYQLRMHLWQGHLDSSADHPYLPPETVMIRNLPSVRLFLERCGQKLPRSRSKWGRLLPEWFTQRLDRKVQRGSAVRQVFLRPTVTEALADTHKYVHNVMRKDSRASLDPVELQAWDKLHSHTIVMNAPGEHDVLVGLSEACGEGAEPRLAATLDGTTRCESSRYWIFRQPLLSVRRLREAHREQKRQKSRPSGFIQHALVAWELLDKIPDVGQRWCLQGKQGQRNKTVLINWLGPDCLRYVHRRWNPKKGNPVNHFPFHPQSSRLLMDCNWVVNALLSVVQDPAVYPFLTPEQARLLSTQYPGFLVVTLSATTPGALSVWGRSVDNVTEPIEDELDVRVLKSLFGQVDPWSLPFPLFLRALLLSRFKMPLLFSTEPLRADAVPCGRSYSPPKHELYFTGLVGKVNFQQDVSPPVFFALATFFTQATQAQLTQESLEADMKTGDEGKVIEDGESWLGSWFSQKSWKKWFARKGARLAPIFENGRLVAEGITKELGTKGMVNLVRDIWLFDTAQLAENESELNSHVATAWFRKYSREIASAEVNAKPEATQIPELKQAIAERLKPQAVRSLQVAFRQASPGRKSSSPGAGQNGQSSALSRVKSWLGGGAQNTPAAGRSSESQTPDDPAILALLKQRPRPDDKIRSMLVTKVEQKIPLGPVEERWAREHHVPGVPLPTGPSPVAELEGYTNRGRPARNAASRVPPGRSGPAPPNTQPLPPFRKIDDEELRAYNEPVGRQDDYFQALAANKVDSDACQGDVTGRYPYPAFDVDVEGRVVARCGRESWMFDQASLTERQLSNLSPSVQQTLMTIRNLALHWCPTLSQEIRLWRWLGVGCLGKLSLDVLQKDALARLQQERDRFDTGDPVAVVRQLSFEEQLKDLQEIRSETKELSQLSHMQAVCHKRVTFLSQTMASGVLFPFVRNHTEAFREASRVSGFVAAILDWSKAGSLKLYQVDPDTRELLHRDLDVADLVKNGFYVPTSLRLWAFTAFDGGVLAHNFPYYERTLLEAVQRHGKAPACLRTLEDLLRYRLVASLPVKLGRQVNDLFRQFQRQGRRLSSQQRRQKDELDKLSQLLQARNLESKQIYIFEQLLNLDRQLVAALRYLDTANRLFQTGTPQSQARANQLIGQAKALKLRVIRTAQKIYRQEDVRLHFQKAQNFENIALCQRAEHVPYMREKVRRRFPELSYKDIQAMDREQLCRTLLHETSVENIIMPVYLWQIRNHPSHLRMENGLLDLWNDTHLVEMNKWLMRFYGVSVQQMRDWNQQYQGKRSFLNQRARLVNSSEDETKTHKAERAQVLLLLRRVIKAKQGCKVITDLKECRMLRDKFSTPHLCEVKGNACANTNISALELVEKTLTALCQPETPHAVEDLEFFTLLSATLQNYYLISKKRTRPAQSGRLVQQCKNLSSMFHTFKRDAAHSQWHKTKMASVVILPSMKEHVRLYFGGSLTTRAPRPLRELWALFAETRPNRQRQIDFTFLVMLHVGFVSGLFVMPENET